MPKIKQNNNSKKNTAMMYSYNAIEYINKPLVKPIIKSMKSVPAGVAAIPTGWDVQADTNARSQGDIQNTLATTLPIYTYMGAVTINPGCLKYTMMNTGSAQYYKLNEPAKRLDIATANIINDITAKMYTDLEITKIVPKFAAEGTDSALTRYAIGVSETAKQWIYDYVNYVRAYQFMQYINNKVVTLSTRANLFLKAFSRARVRTAVESLAVALKQYPVPKHIATYIKSIATLDINNDACNGTLTSVTLKLGWSNFSQHELVDFCTLQEGKAGANGIQIYTEVETNDTANYANLNMGGNMLATILHNYYTMSDVEWAEFCVKFSNFMAENLEQHSTAVLANVSNLAPYITAIARVPEYFLDAYDFDFSLESLDVNYIQNEPQILTLNMIKEVYHPSYADVAGTSVVVGQAPILGDDILQPMAPFRTNGILQWIVPTNATYEPLIDISNMKFTTSYGIITDDDPITDYSAYAVYEDCEHIPTKFYTYTYGNDTTIGIPTGGKHERLYRSMDKYLKASAYSYNLKASNNTIKVYNWADYGTRPVTLEPIDQLVAQAAPMVYGFKTPLSKIAR